MVLTRAQRAQTKATPPESPPKTSALQKAPARRGRTTKKADAEAEQDAKPVKAAKSAPATKPALASKATAATKSTALKSSTTTKAATARTATTKAAAAKAAPAKAAPAKAPAAKAATKASSLKASTAKAPATKKAAATKTAKTAKITKKPAPAEEEVATAVEEPVVEEPTVEGQIEDDQDKENKPQQAEEDKQDEAKDSQQAEEVKPSVPSPTKLPQPVADAPASPFKMSLLSSKEALGSVRKPPVTGALFASPTKAAGLMQPPMRSNGVAASPIKMNTSIRDFAEVLGSPRRPGSSGSDGGAAQQSDENAKPQEHNEENKKPEVKILSAVTESPTRPTSSGSDKSTPSKRSSTDDAPIFSPPKRLRTSMSMPSLGSPMRSQASSSGSPPSPTKSSLRSPVKRPGISPKKVSWHQTPPRPPPIAEKTPPTKQPGILDGCVFFLDINSLNGACQNSLFDGLVQELGGVVVPDWMHNNMGITHVLFMNGEIRTLEKVLASNGGVHCVSLGWLLDCQRENVRIPENQPRYLIDLTSVPGHTPKPNRTALNTPMTAKTRTPGPVSHTPAIPPPKWALPSTPAVPREPLGALSSSVLIKTPSMFALTAQTPRPPPSVGMGTIDEHDKENMSPVSEVTPLVQKTCPPKQLNKSMFTMSTGIGATPLRNKFLASKRRRSFDGLDKVAAGMQSPPRKGLGLGSPKRPAGGFKSPAKKAHFGF